MGNTMATGGEEEAFCLPGYVNFTVSEAETKWARGNYAPNRFRKADLQICYYIMRGVNGFDRYVTAHMEKDLIHD